MEEYLKILKVEYLSNHLLDHTQILNLSLYDQTIFRQRPPMEGDLRWKMTSKYQKWNISATTYWIIPKF